MPHPPPPLLFVLLSVPSPCRMEPSLAVLRLYNSLPALMDSFKHDPQGPSVHTQTRKAALKLRFAHCGVARQNAAELSTSKIRS